MAAQKAVLSYRAAETEATGQKVVSAWTGRHWHCLPWCKDTTCAFLSCLASNVPVAQHTRIQTRGIVTAGRSISRCDWLINSAYLVEMKCWVSKRQGFSAVPGGTWTLRCGCSLYKCTRDSFLLKTFLINDSTLLAALAPVHPGLLIGLLKQDWFSLKKD